MLIGISFIWFNIHIRFVIQFFVYLCWTVAATAIVDDRIAICLIECYKKIRKRRQQYEPKPFVMISRSTDIIFYFHVLFRFSFPIVLFLWAPHSASIHSSMVHVRANAFVMRVWFKVFEISSERVLYDEFRACSIWVPPPMPSSQWKTAHEFAFCYKLSKYSNSQMYNIYENTRQLNALAHAMPWWLPV